MNNISIGESTRVEILAAIRRYYDMNEFSPSIREMARMVNIKSTSTIHKHMQILREQGKINFNAQMTRTIIFKEA